jgi:hypothetical protein
VQLPFEEFIPLFRAKTVKDGAKLDPSTVTSIQVCISNILISSGGAQSLQICVTFVSMPHCIAQHYLCLSIIFMLRITTIIIIIII